MTCRNFCICLAAALFVSNVAMASVPRVTVRQFDDKLVGIGKQFAQLANAGNPVIEIRIDSFGGGVFAGLSFIQFIEDVKLQTGVLTVCVVDTKAMSMGFALLQSGACDVRLMTKRSILLAHNASGGGSGTAEDMEESLELLKAVNRAMAEVCGARLKIGVKGYLDKVNASKSWVMTWEEALAVGAVDGVI